jgi:hypothetical protein
MGDEREPKWLPDTPPTLPRGLHGGTNGEVSWLRDSTRLPGFPVAFRVESLASKGQVTRYSGGAAPDLHRLPSIRARDVGRMIGNKTGGGKMRRL